MTINPDVVDSRKESVSFTLSPSMIEWIEKQARIETEGNRSMALSRMLRKLARYEQAEAEGRLTISKAA